MVLATSLFYLICHSDLSIAETNKLSSLNQVFIIVSQTFGLNLEILNQICLLKIMPVHNWLLAMSAASWDEFS